MQVGAGRLNVVVKLAQVNFDPTVRAYYDFPSVLFWHDQAEVSVRRRPHSPNAAAFYL